jgi:hypothetical protein
MSLPVSALRAIITLPLATISRRSLPSVQNDSPRGLRPAMSGGVYSHLTVPVAAFSA